MWSIRRNVDCLTGSDSLFDAAEAELQLALKYGECLLEVMTVRRRASAWRDVHIDQAEASGSVSSVKKDGVRVSNYSDVRKFPVSIRLSK
jgi:hypothetical protein